MSERQRLARDQVVQCSLSLAASRMDFEAHPDNPNGNAEIEYRIDALDDAIEQSARLPR